MKIAFKTLGCKVNQYETQAIREQFLGTGFTEVDKCADVYIINTCTVTRKADSDSRRLIRAARRENPDSKIVVTGCYAELDENEIKRLADGLIVIKNADKDKISRYLLLSRQNRLVGVSRFEGRTKAFVKIQDGCDNFCSYCKVPLVRGRSRSRRPEEVIKEIAALVSNGYKEIILCGICLGDWGKDMNLKLSWLLGEIADNLSGEFRVRLSSIEPWYVTPDLLRMIADSDKFCRHLHIPMQSGDDEILKKMNRDFMTKEFVSLINKFRALIPEAAFTTDILIGFPGETEERFNNTLRMVELTRPSRVHVFPFSARAATKAILLEEDNIPRQIVSQRAAILRSLADKLKNEYKNRFLGKEVKVLVETQRDRKAGLLTGFTDTYIKTAFQGPDELKGRFTVLTLTN